MDRESFCGEGVRGWIKDEKKFLRKIPQNPSSNPKHKATLEELETYDVLKVTMITTKTQTQFNPTH